MNKRKRSFGCLLTLMVVSIVLFLLYSDPPPLPFNKTERLFMHAYQVNDSLVFISSDDDTLSCIIDEVDNGIHLGELFGYGFPVPFRREFKVNYYVNNQVMSPVPLIRVVRYNSFSEGFVSYIDCELAFWMTGNNGYKGYRFYPRKKEMKTSVYQGMQSYVLPLKVCSYHDQSITSNPNYYIRWSQQYGTLEIHVEGKKTWHLEKIIRKNKNILCRI